MLRRALDLRIKKPGFLVLILPVLYWNLEGLAENFKALLSSLDFILCTGAQQGQSRVFE